MGRRPEQTFFQRENADGQQAHEKTINITNHQENANQTTMSYTSHLSEWPSSKRTQITNVVEDVEQRELSCNAGGNVNWCSHCRKTVWRFLKNLKIGLPYDPAISHLGIYPTKQKH